jgi:hypothetical protein
MSRRARRRASRPKGFDLDDWATWAVRAMVTAILAVGWAAWNNMQTIESSLASITTKIDSHSDQLKAIWEHLSKRP